MPVKTNTTDENKSLSSLSIEDLSKVIGGLDEEYIPARVADKGSFGPLVPASVLPNGTVPLPPLPSPDLIMAGVMAAIRL